MDIKKLRESLLMTQPEFAKLIGVSTYTISLWETNKVKQSLRHKRKIIEICQENKLDIKDFIKK